MKKIIQILLLFTLIISFTNCTLTKRSYRTGYHISWKSAGKSRQVSTEKSKTSADKTDEKNLETSLEKQVDEIDIENSDLEHKENSVEPKNERKQEKVYTKDLKKAKKKPNLEVFKKKFHIELSEEKADEPTAPEDGIDELDVLLFILGFIACLLLVLPLFLLGFLFYAIASDGFYIGAYSTAEWFGILTAAIFYWLSSWGMLIVFFPKRDATIEEKRYRIAVKAIIALGLAIIGTAILVLVVI
ncbi:MAG: hypothetical protein P8P77_02555 [Crocinitomicaceae bacterium]|nr:hypothetical protein [Crocinitomicaceae bacterium]